MNTVGSFSEGKRKGHEADQSPDLAQWLKMSGAIPLFLHVLSHRAQRQRYLYFTYNVTRKTEIRCLIQGYIPVKISACFFGHLNSNSMLYDTRTNTTTEFSLRYAKIQSFPLETGPLARRNQGRIFDNTRTDMN